MSPDQAWNLALVDVSRDTREGTTSTNAELSSRLEGGRGNERRSPNSTVPGVNDPTGVPTRVSREMSAAEAAEYNRRSPPREGGEATAGGYEYSQRDRDNMARGLIPVQTPEGVRYMESAEPEGNMPGRPGVPGVRPDLVERGYEVVTVNNVTGRPRRVYQYTGAGAERANRTRPAAWGGAQGGTPFAINQRLRALAEQAGIPVEEARRIVEQHVQASQADNGFQKDKDGNDVLDENGNKIPTGTDNDIVMGSQASFQPLRDMAATRSQNDRLERVQRVRRNAMLAGGQPTGGPGGTIAATNALGMLPQEWQNQVLANRLTGGAITGATPLDVQGNQLRLGNRLLTAEALSGELDGSREERLFRMTAAQRQEERMRTLRGIAATAAQGAWSPELAARQALEAQGATPQEIDLIMNDLSAGGSLPAPSGARAPGRPAASNGAAEELGVDPERVAEGAWDLPPPATVPQPPFMPGRMPDWRR
jgi:DNA-binding PadR family transcriptional regulator